MSATAMTETETFDALLAASEEARRRCEAAADEWDVKFYRFTPIVGLVYAHPAWCRYMRAYADAKRASAEFQAFAATYLARSTLAFARDWLTAQIQRRAP